MTDHYELDDGEVVVRRINRSVMNLLPVTSACVVVIVLISLGIWAYANYKSSLYFLPTQSVQLVIVAMIALVAVCGALLMGELYVYRRNFLLITNMHIIKHEQDGLFTQKTAQLSLGRIQDITGGRRGILGTVCNFGNVEIESAAAQENFVFEFAPSPQLLADQLIKIHEDYMGEHPGAPAA